MHVPVMVVNGKHEAVAASCVCLQYTGFLLQQQSDTLGVTIGSGMQQGEFLKRQKRRN